MPELYILGNPPASVVAFGSKTIDPHAVGDVMSTKGWHLNALANPPAVHIACTKLTIKNVDNFLKDLRDSIDEVKQRSDDGSKPGTMVTLYGA